MAANLRTGLFALDPIELDNELLLGTSPLRDSTHYGLLSHPEVVAQNYCR